MSYTHIEITIHNPIARLTINWPEKRNALSVKMMEEISCALEDLGSNTNIRAVIIGAQGPVFSAGHFLPEMIDQSLSNQQLVFDTCVKMMEKLQKIPQPVIAEVQGTATAAGCQLVAASDLAVAAREAKFATPGVKIGLFCTTPMVALTRAVGRKRAMQMLLTGEFISADTAAEWGLINLVVSQEQLRAETEALALKVADASNLVVSIGKQAFYTQIDLEQTQAYSYSKEVMSMNAMALDAQEGMKAFLQKRKPHWIGK